MDKKVERDDEQAVGQEPLNVTRRTALLGMAGLMLLRRRR